MTARGISINGIQTSQNIHKPIHIIGCLSMDDVKINGTCRRAMKNGGSPADNDKLHSR